MSFSPHWVGNNYFPVVVGEFVRIGRNELAIHFSRCKQYCELNIIIDWSLADHDPPDLATTENSQLVDMPEASASKKTGRQLTAVPLEQIELRVQPSNQILIVRDVSYQSSTTVRPRRLTNV
jgi:hypothetical protein